MPREGLRLANQRPEFGVFDRKLEGNHCIILYLFDKYLGKISNNVFFVQQFD